MAAVNIIMGRPTMPGTYVGVAIMDVHAASETIDSSGTSQATTITAELGDALQVTALADVWVVAGAAPTAVVNGSGAKLVAAGQTRDFGFLRPGDKVAVINDS